jgi:hypothetical protein
LKRIIPAELIDVKGSTRRNCAQEKLKNPSTTNSFLFILSADYQMIALDSRFRGNDKTGAFDSHTSAVIRVLRDPTFFPLGAAPPYGSAFAENVKGTNEQLLLVLKRSRGGAQLRNLLPVNRSSNREPQSHRNR